MQNFKIADLTNNRLFECLVNSIVLNNRLMRLCSELDDLRTEFKFLNNFNLKNFIFQYISKKEKEERVCCVSEERGMKEEEKRKSEKVATYNKEKRFPKSSNEATNSNNSSFQKETTRNVPVTSESKRELDKKLISSRKIESNLIPKSEESLTRSDELVYELENNEATYEQPLKMFYLKIIIRKLCFIDPDISTCSKIIRKSQLRLPCKKSSLIHQIFKADPYLSESCLIMIKKKFEKDIINVCSSLNYVMSKFEKDEIADLRLYCDIRASYIKFRLKSIKNDRKHNFFVIRVPVCQNVKKYISCETCSQFSFKEEAWKWEPEDIEHEEMSQWKAEENHEEKNSRDQSPSKIKEETEEIELKSEIIARFEIEEKESRQQNEKKIPKTTEKLNSKIDFLLNNKNRIEQNNDDEIYKLTVLKSEKKENLEKLKCHCAVDLSSKTSGTILETIDEMIDGCDSNCMCGEDYHETINKNYYEYRRYSISNELIVLPSDSFEVVPMNQKKSVSQEINVSSMLTSQISLKQSNSNYVICAGEKRREEFSEMELEESQTDSIPFDLSPYEVERIMRILPDLPEDKNEKNNSYNSKQCMMSYRSRISAESDPNINKARELSPEMESTSKSSSSGSCENCHEVLLKSQICFSRLSSSSSKSGKSISKNSGSFSSQISTNTLNSTYRIISRKGGIGRESWKSGNYCVEKRGKVLKPKPPTRLHGNCLAEISVMRKVNSSSTFNSTEHSSRRSYEKLISCKENVTENRRVHRKQEQKRVCKRPEVFQDVVAIAERSCHREKRNEENTRKCENFPRFDRRKLPFQKHLCPLRGKDSKVRRIPYTKITCTYKYKKQSSTSGSTKNTQKAYRKHSSCKEFSYSHKKKKRSFVPKNFKDSFSYKSVDRIKHLIKKKLRKMLVNSRDKGTNTSKECLNERKEKKKRSFNPSSTSLTYCRMCQRPLKVRVDKNSKKRPTKPCQCCKANSRSVSTSENISASFNWKEAIRNAQKFQKQRQKMDKIRLLFFRNRRSSSYHPYRRNCRRFSSSHLYTNSQMSKSSRSIDIFFLNEANDFLIGKQRKGKPIEEFGSFEKNLRTCCENNPGNWENFEEEIVACSKSRKNYGKESIEGSSISQEFFNENDRIEPTTSRSRDDMKYSDWDQMLVLESNRSKPLSINLFLGNDYDPPTSDEICNREIFYEETGEMEPCDKDSCDPDTDFKNDSPCYVPLCDCIKKRLRDKLGLDDICETTNNSISSQEK